MSSAEVWWCDRERWALRVTDDGCRPSAPCSDGCGARTLGPVRRTTPAPWTDPAGPHYLETGDEFVCQSCLSSSDTRVGIIAHMRTHGATERCSGCGGTFKVVGGMARHRSNGCPGPRVAKERFRQPRATQLHPPPEGIELLWPRHVAEMFEVTPKQVQVWARQGDLEFVVTSGSHRRFPAKQFEGR